LLLSFIDGYTSLGTVKVGANTKMQANIHKIAKVLRKRPTDAERLLWKHLKAKQLEGFKFRRQQPIGNYVADFVCFEKRIVVEIDGSQHAVEKEREKDITRDSWFTKQGFKILRFWNNEVMQQTEGVLEVIKNTCLSCPSLTPPTRRGEG
jgi:very-short-patch-repair endonuclease